VSLVQAAESFLPALVDVRGQAALGELAAELESHERAGREAGHALVVALSNATEDGDVGVGKVRVEVEVVVIDRHPYLMADHGEPLVELGADHLDLGRGVQRHALHLEEERVAVGVVGKVSSSGTLSRSSLSPIGSSRKIRGSMGAGSPSVGADTADVGQQAPWLAGQVGAHVPGLSLRHQRGARDLLQLQSPCQSCRALLDTVDEEVRRISDECYVHGGPPHPA
jgi:hypothetical protein